MLGRLGSNKNVCNFFRRVSLNLRVFYTCAEGVIEKKTAYDVIIFQFQRERKLPRLSIPERLCLMVLVSLHMDDFLKEFLKKKK